MKTSAQLTTEGAQDFAFQSALIETAHAQMDSNLMRMEQLVSQVIISRDFSICTFISGLRRMRSFLSRVDEARSLLFVTFSILHNYDARLVSAKLDRIAKDITSNSVHGTVLKNNAATDWRCTNKMCPFYELFCNNFDLREITDTKMC